MTVVGTSIGGRTFVQAVDRIIRDIGESGVSTLLTPSNRVSTAMRAVEDARDEVYYKTMWKFRRGHLSIALVAGRMWYEAPNDYHKLATFISRNSVDEKIWFKTYDDIMLEYPNLRIFPPGTGVQTPEGVAQAASQLNTIGTPAYCTDYEGYIGLFPMPDAAFVELDGTLYAHYWKHAPALVGDYDDIGLPRELWLAHHHLALGKLKKAVEYGDWEADIAIGKRELATASASAVDPMDANREHRDTINYNE
jgi:hypothetical protein